MRRIVVLVVFPALSLLAACAQAPREPLAVMPEAATWAPLVMNEADRGVPPPPAPGSAEARADADGLRAWAAARGEAERAAIATWTRDDPARAWGAVARELVARQDVPDAARAAAVYAHVQAAALDAMTACWAAKAAYQRPAPPAEGALLPPTPGLPSYPSEHAAVAMACAGVLGAAFPEAADGLVAKAQAVATVPVAAGFAWPSDVAAGRALGERAAAAARARLAEDGRKAAVTPAPGADGRWRDPWPLPPAAGAWAPWVLGAPAEAAPPAPGPGFAAEVAVVGRENRAMTIRRRALAVKWLEGDMASVWHARAADLAGRHRLAAPAAARVLAFTAIALADAAIACRHAQFRLGRPRPGQLDPGIEPVVPVPATPAWPADPAALATAAAGYLAAEFPLMAAELARDAAEAAEAGRYAGWHVASDVAAGTAVGRAVAARVVAAARADGAP